MMLLLRLFCHVYDLTIRLYPAALAGTYGSEMREIFRQQTSDAWRDHGWTGLLPVLWCGFQEFLTEAIAPRACSTAVMSGATSLVLTSLTFGSLLWALENPLPLKALGDRLPQAIWDNGRRAPSPFHRHPSRPAKGS